MILTAAAGLACIPGTALAFLTAEGQAENQVWRGENTSSVEEEFEQPDLLESGVEHRIRKEVKVKNEDYVPCYVGLIILETSSEAEWSRSLIHILRK